MTYTHLRGCMCETERAGERWRKAQTPWYHTKVTHTHTKYLNSEGQPRRGEPGGVGLLLERCNGTLYPLLHVAACYLQRPTPLPEYKTEIWNRGYTFRADYMKKKGEGNRVELALEWEYGAALCTQWDGAWRQENKWKVGLHLKHKIRRKGVRREGSSLLVTT